MKFLYLSRVLEILTFSSHVEWSKYMYDDIYHISSYSLLSCNMIYDMIYDLPSDTAQSPGYWVMAVFFIHMKF